MSKESEVSRLKREFAKATEERDILENAAAYFARELPRSKPSSGNMPSGSASHVCV